MLQPNQAALLLLFGDYRGNDRNEDHDATPVVNTGTLYA